MSKRFIVVGSILAILFLSLLIPTQSRAQDELPEGVAGELVAVWPSDIAGIKEIKLWKFTFQPGAIWKDIPVAGTEFWHATQGIFTVVNQTQGTTVVYAAGSYWLNEKGNVVTVSNPGDVPAVQWVHELVSEE